MRTKFILFILLCNHLYLRAQDTIYHTALPEQGIHLLVADQIGRAFVSKNNHVWCLADDGSLLWSWQNPLFSSISSIDANNPLKIVLYYKDENQIEILDKNGKLLNTIDLNTWGYTDIISISSAADNSFWLYDQQQKALLNISSTGTLLSKTINISLLSDSKILNPSITLSNSSIYLCINNYEVISFDTQSSFKKKQTFQQDLTMINITNNDNIYHLKLDKILCQSLVNPTKISIIFEPIKPANLIYFTDLMYVIDEGKILKLNTHSAH